MKVINKELINDGIELILENKYLVIHCDDLTKDYFLMCGARKPSLLVKRNDAFTWRIPDEIYDTDINIKIEIRTKRHELLYTTNFVKINITRYVEADNTRSSLLKQINSFSDSNTSFSISPFVANGEIDTSQALQFEIINRTIDVPLNLTDVFVEGDHNSRIISFNINRYFDGLDLASKMICIKYTNADNLSGRDDATLVTVAADTFIFKWKVTSSPLIKNGNIFFSVEFYEKDEKDQKIYVWQTLKSMLKVEAGIINLNNAVFRDFSFEKMWLQNNDNLNTYQIIDDNPPIQIINRKIINVNVNNFVVSGDSNSQLLSFNIIRHFDGVDLSKKTISVKFINANKLSGLSSIGNLNITDNNIEFVWVLDSRVSIKEGEVLFAIEFLDIDEFGVSYALQTEPSSFNVEKGLVSLNNAIFREFSIASEWLQNNDNFTVYQMTDDSPIIQIINKNIMMPQNTDLVVVGDANSQLFTFEMDRFLNGVDLSQKTVSINFINADNTGDKSNIINFEISKDKIRFGWLLDSNVSIKEGIVNFDIEILGLDEYGKFYCTKTLPARFSVSKGLSVDNDVQDTFPTILQDYEIRIGELEKMVIDLQSGGTTEQPYLGSVVGRAVCGLAICGRD